MRVEPVPVFVGGGSVDDEQQVVFSEAIDEQIVYDRAGGCSERRILRLPVHELAGVVRAETIDEGDGVSTAHFDLAHVRHVEETGVAARAQVLLDRAGRILHGHVPAAEVHHASARAAVQRIELGLLQRRRRQKT